MLDREPEQPLSPELVLVSPDLRERAASEEREVHLAPRADAAPPAAPPPPAMPAATPPPSVPAAPPTPVVPAAAPPVPPSTQTTSARVEWRLTVGAATVLALSALLVFGAGIAVGQLALPVSQTPPAAAHGSTQGRPATAPIAAPAAAAAPIHETKASSLTTDGLDATPPSVMQASPRAPAPKSPVASRVLPSSPSAPTGTEARQRKPPAAPARPVKHTPKAVRPIPNGGYAFFEGSFQLTADGRTVTGFTLRTTACAGPLVVPPIDVSPSGTFTYSGHPAGSLPGTRVRLTGRFVSRADARGTTRVTRGACHATATPFVAHLS